MASRAWPKLYTIAHAAPSLLVGVRSRPTEVRRLLIAQHLLLGDTIMLTPLLKKARALFPAARIVMAVPRAHAPLYAARPYDVKALPFDPRSLADYASLRSERGFDLALVPGDNRWSWLARMMKARWVVAFAPDRSTYKDVPVDEFVRMPQEPLAWGDIAAHLLEGREPEPYRPGEWPAPPFRAYRRPPEPYCVLHLGASSPHKRWPSDRWRALMEWTESRGYAAVLSAGPGEESLLAPVDPDGRHSALAGKLDLAQLWDLLSGAAFLVCPDTGVAHLARLVGVPTVAIFGPGSPISTGAGRFWAGGSYRPLWDPDVPCRDQDMLFERRLPWMRQCWRSVTECGDPVCVRRVDLSAVILAIQSLVPSAAP